MNENIQKVINNVNQTWDKDLIIRYLYINIAPYITRDLNYFCASEKEKEKQYKKGFINRFPYVVCKTLADFYVQIFNNLGIEAYCIAANSAKIPLYALIVRGNKGWYFLDPLSDLLNNQYNLRTINFGIIPHYKTTNSMYPNLRNLPPEYLEELDKTLNPNLSYRNDAIQFLRDMICERNKACKFFAIPKNDRILLTQSKIQLMNDYLINLGSVNGPFERTRLYGYLFFNLLSRNEERQMRVYLDDIDGQMATVYIKLYINPENYLLYREEKKDNKFQLKLIK